MATEDWHRLIDFRNKHRVGADIARSIGKKISMLFERVKNEVYFTNKSFYREKTGLNSFDFFSQGIMEYRLLGQVGLTTYGRKIYVNQNYDIKIEGYKYDEETGKFLMTDEKMPNEFFPLVELQHRYVKDYEDDNMYKVSYNLIWGKNKGDKPTRPNRKSQLQEQKERQEEKEQQERMLETLQATATEAVASVLEEQQKAAQKAFEAGLAAAEERMRNRD